MRTLPAFLMALVLVPIGSHAQDTQSLGDLARQVRAQKELQGTEDAKDPAASTDKSVKDEQPKAASHVFTNEDIPEHHERATRSHSSALPEIDPAESPASREAEGRRWKGEILTQKSKVSELQSQIASLSSSIRYSTRGVRWNEAQQRKQQQVDVLKSRLDEQQVRLEDMQESARRRGYGSSVWDP